MNNINNSSRLSLKDNKTPYKALINVMGVDVAKKLNLYYIKPNDVNLSKNLLNNLMESYRKYDKKLSEKSKKTNQIEWIKLMNNYKNTAE